MNRHFGHISLIGIILVLPLTTRANDSPLTLNETVKAAVEQSPRLRATQAGVAEARAARREAKSRHWPQVSARSQFTRGDDPVYVFGSLLRQQSFGPQNFAVPALNNPGYYSNIASALELGVPIFTGFELKDAGDMARLGETMAEVQSSGLTQKLRYDGLEASLQVLLAREQLSVLDERLGSARKELADARRLKEKGLVLGSDYYAAEAIAGGMEACRAQTKKHLDAATARLSLLTNLSIGTSTLAGSLSGRTYEVGPAEDWASRAVKNRADLQQAKIQESLADVARRQARHSLLPKIDAFAMVETNTEDFHRNPSDRVAGVRASIALGDPGFGPRRQRAQARQEAGRFHSQAVEQSVHEEIIQAWTGYQTAVETLPLIKSSLEQAEKSLELFRPLYREGRQSILEVLRAEEGLARAGTTYIGTLYQVHAGYARLRLASGELTDDDIQTIQNHLGVQP